MLQENPAIRPSDIGEELGLSRSTVHRLLATLEAEEFVQRDRVQQSYRAGRTLIKLGIAAVGDLDVRKTARSYMEELADATKETVHLFVHEGAKSRIVDGVEGSLSVRVAPEVGAVYPAHACAGGKALLATLSNDELHALFPRGLPKITDCTITQWEAFTNEMETIRRLGYAINRGESDASVSGVAVQVSDRTGRVVAALALSVPRERMSAQKALDFSCQLRLRAERIGASLI